VVAKEEDNLCGKQPTRSGFFIRHGIWLGFTLLVLAVLVKLSLWQHSRGIEKQQRLDRIVQLNQQSPLTLSQIIALTDKSTPQASTTENINDYPVSITGSFNNEKVFLLDNQVEKGSLGYRVFQIVSSGKHNVLVNLGWVQGSINRQELPNFTPISGQHSFSGHIRLIEPGIMLMPQHFNKPSWPLRVQQIELDVFSSLIDEPLLPFVVYLDESEKLGFKKNWHPIVMPPEKHQAYSFQWAGLAIAWLALMIWFNLFEKSEKTITTKKHNNK
jgi:surfeit locus 1 family protein